MARIRTIKPEFFTSPDTASVSHSARLLYIAMWSWADDYGRGEMNMLQLRAFAFPEEDQWLDSELQSKGKEFQSLCKEVVNGFKLKVYKHRGRTFYAIPSWDEHQKTQRRAKSKYPAPDDPDSTPDQRFHGSEGSSEEKRGSSESTQGNAPSGTGEQGNRGTGELKDMSGSDEPDVAEKPDPPKPSKPKQTRRTYSPEFEEFWKAYPLARGASKYETSQKFHTALKVTDAQTIIEAAHRFAHDPNRVDEYTPMPTTWLNKRRWEAGPLPARNQQPPHAQQAPTNTMGGWLGMPPQPQQPEITHTQAPFGVNIIDHEEIYQ